MDTRERRSKRSNDPLVALHYQLAHTRSQASLDTIVVADDSGVVVAGAGTWAACEELAAMAPFLADESSSSERLGTLQAETITRKIQLGSSGLILVGKRRKGTPVTENVIDRVSEGITRILAA